MISGQAMNNGGVTTYITNDTSGRTGSASGDVSFQHLCTADRSSSLIVPMPEDPTLVVENPHIDYSGRDNVDTIERFDGVGMAKLFDRARLRRFGTCSTVWLKTTASTPDPERWH